VVRGRRPRVRIAHARLESLPRARRVPLEAARELASEDAAHFELRPEPRRAVTILGTSGEGG
jgi:hypothetical protein